VYLIRTVEHRSSNPRVETFPGAACYTTLGSANIFRGIVRWVWQRSKAAPLQAAAWQLDRGYTDIPPLERLKTGADQGREQRSLPRAGFSPSSYP
jgi:hypothetical protein